jgi:hypothetical protein
MTDQSYPGHENDAVDAHAPLFGEHLLRLLPERSRSRRASPRLLGLEELLRLWEADADQSNGDGDGCTSPEDRFPGIGSTADAKIGTSRHDISKGVSLLEYTTHQTTGIGTVSISVSSSSVAAATYGQFSNAIAMALPYTPPMKRPKILRTARNCWKVLE